MAFNFSSIIYLLVVSFTIKQDNIIAKANIPITINIGVIVFKFY